MKRHSRRRWTVALAACVIPVICCSAAARAADGYAEHAGLAATRAGNMRQLLQRVQPAVAPSAGSAAYFGDVPASVVGVYGATTLDMLSGGPLILVRWPNDCCSASQRWHARGHARNTSAHSKADDTHIFFLWPEM